MALWSHPLKKLRRLGGGAWFHLRQRIARGRRQVLRLWREPDLARKLSAYRRHQQERDWAAVLDDALELAALAEARRDARLMEELGKELEPLGAHARSAELRLRSRHLRAGVQPKEWNGEDIAKQTLLVNLFETTKQGLSVAIKRTGLVGQAAGRAGRCILLVEPRLVPLFRRTFPHIDVRPAGAADGAAYAEADRVAGEHQLMALFATDAEMIAQSFVRLCPDPELVAEFRARYRGANARPLVGISWASSAYTKQVPTLGDWAGFLRGVDATFVSLQYGDIASDLAVLGDGDPDRIIHDRSVDQLVDMDRFAAQVASLDAVISISNTGAHLAGALAVPTILILDDRLRIWPVFGDTSPWYPKVVLVRKQGREWASVMQEVGARLESILAAAPTRRASPDRALGR